MYFKKKYLMIKKKIKLRKHSITKKKIKNIK